MKRMFSINDFLCENDHEERGCIYYFQTTTPHIAPQRIFIRTFYREIMSHVTQNSFILRYRLQNLLNSFIHLDHKQILKWVSEIFKIPAIF